MGREMIGKGHEHKVFRAKREYLLNGQKRHLALKTPTFINQLLLFVFNFSPDIISQEHHEAEDLLLNTPVKIPEWRVITMPTWKREKQLQKPWRYFFNRGKGYITIQELIEEDNSIADIRGVLKDTPWLLHRFNTNPTNFITQKGEVYYIDPTKSIHLSGILDRLHILPKEKYSQIQQEITRAWHDLKQQL